MSELTVLDEDDLFQEGWLLLEQARDNFEDIEGYEFGVYAWSFIQTRLIDYIRKEENIKNWESYQYKEGMGAKGFDEDRIRGGVKLESAGLEGRDQRIIELIGEGYTHAEIADKLGVTRSAISHRIRKIREEIKSQIHEKRK